VSFTIFPAIDLRAGQVVRLRHGDPAQQTTFSDDPAVVARHWESLGAQWLHVVNLDGALAGPDRGQGRGQGQGQGRGEDLNLNLSLNLRRLAEIRAATQIPIQFGGGLREIDDIALALALGATRVVLGTVAVRQPQVVAQAVARFGAERIVVGIDARAGRAAIAGWQETSAVDAITVGRLMRDLGVTRSVYTDISRDGALTGVNVTATAQLAAATGLKIIASGGVAGLDDIISLVGYVQDGIEGVIVGQALYTGHLDLREALARA